MIFTLASLLTFPDEPKIDSLWVKIQRVFSTAGMAITPLPHFSWHVAQTYDFARLEPRLSAFARSLEPFRIHIAGIGVFSGEKPVIYLPVTKTPVISAVHNELSEWITEYTTLPNPNYEPNIWIPHITLSDEDFNSDSVCQVVSELAYIPLNIEINVDQFAIIYRDEDTSGVKRNFVFGVGLE